MRFLSDLNIYGVELRPKNCSRVMTQFIVLIFNCRMSASENCFPTKQQLKK